MQHVPRYLVRALQRHPALLADLLGLHNRLRAWVSEPRSLLALCAAVLLGSIAIVAVVVSGRTWFAAGLEWMVTYRVWSAVLAALYASMQVGQRRRWVERQLTGSWLIAAPRVVPTLSSLKLWRTLWPLAVQVLLLGACVAVLASLDLTPADVGRLAAWILAGVVLGASAGWWWVRWRSSPAEQARYEDSRYAPRPRRELHGAASTRALTRLPIARALTWYRPENARMFFLVTVLLLPAGISAQAGIAVLMVLGLISYAGNLAHAVIRTGTETALWLRGTPLRFATFAWPIMRRAVLHQVILSMVIGGLLCAVGVGVGAVLYLALSWLTLVLMIWTLWLRGCYDNERVLFKTVGSVVSALGLEQLVRGLGIACAVVWTAWHLRRRPA